MDTDRSSDIIAFFLLSIIYVSVCVVLFLYIFGAVKFKFKDIKDNLEYFELGRTYNTRPTFHMRPSAGINLRPNSIPVKNKKTKKSKSKPAVKKTTSPLHKDCVLALNALGVKKSSAKEEVKEFFSHNNVDTVEEFLQKYMKK